MKHNLMVACNNYDFAKKISNELAEFFSMRVFDELELLSFDFAPTTIDELKTNFGNEFVFNKLSKTLSAQCEFENVVFVTHYETIQASKQIFEKLKENDFIILLKYDNGSNELIEDKLFKDKISDLDYENLKNELADISFTINSDGENVLDRVIAGIKQYYNF